MSTEIVSVKKSKTPSVQGWTPEQMHLMKTQIARGCSDDQVLLFASVCLRTGLDPFQKQIYAIPRRAHGEQTMTIQTGIDGYRLIADRTGQYVGSDQPVFLADNSGTLTQASVTVYKLVQGIRCAFTGTAIFREYSGGESGMWKKMPFAMLAKCAEALALRKAFPADLSGLLTHEEMDQADAYDEPKHQENKVFHGPPKLAAPIPQEKITPAQMSEIVTAIAQLGWDEPTSKRWKEKLRTRFPCGIQGLTETQARECLDLLRAEKEPQ